MNGKYRVVKSNTTLRHGQHYATHIGVVFIDNQENTHYSTTTLNKSGVGDTYENSAGYKVGFQGCADTTKTQHAEQSQGS